MSKAWEYTMGDSSHCGNEVCLGMVESNQINDHEYMTNPMQECPDMLHPMEKPPSFTTQWQQDWYVFWNFFSNWIDMSPEGV